LVVICFAKSHANVFLSQVHNDLRLIEIVTLVLPVARFEKTVEHDSMKVRVAEVANRSKNDQLVSRSSEGNLK
jgi:hypothetical protein